MLMDLFPQLCIMSHLVFLFSESEHLSTQSDYSNGNSCRCIFRERLDERKNWFSYKKNEGKNVILSMEIVLFSHIFYSMTYWEPRSFKAIFLYKKCQPVQAYEVYFFVALFCLAPANSYKTVNECLPIKEEL